MFKFFDEVDPIESLEKGPKRLYDNEMVHSQALTDPFFKDANVNWDALYNLCLKRKTEVQDIESPWQLVAFSGDKALIEKYFGAYPELLNLKHKKNGRTPLHFAAWSGSLEAVKYFVRHNNQVESSDICGSPLQYAAKAGADDVMLYLKEQGADPLKTHPNTGDTLVHLAVQSESLAAIKKAISFDVDPTKRNDAGKTPLDVAQELDITDIRDYFKDMYPATCGVGCVIL